MTTHNPYRPGTSRSGLVDHMIGRSYEVVRTVYDNLCHIRTVACNLPAIRVSANNIHRSIVTLEGEAGALGEIVQIDLPDSILENEILDFNVLLVGSDFAVYNTGFSARILDGKLEVTVASNAPSVLANSTIRYTLSYRN